MNKESIIKLIEKEKPFLFEKFGVDEIGLFGSFARGDEKTGSDLDLFVSLRKPSYSLFIGLIAYLEKKLNSKIDLVRKGPHISERFLNQIKKDLIYV